MRVFEERRIYGGIDVGVRMEVDEVFFRNC